MSCICLESKHKPTLESKMKQNLNIAYFILLLYFWNLESKSGFYGLPRSFYPLTMTSLICHCEDDRTKQKKTKI
ncbi:hypothetical protein [Helicobacter fennelliae]|uniref:Uncharacterized protein n=1 Tax=Helicobacter fennelliae MRY12-0050 TaxID=1325130 RepID=T1D0A5_9HELI|nr:hypothetical protein [Helicobacter fennelliae]GAD19615.1 hypothetical protein HFN_0855 [Helicobacter fennelliae MRY12-0050]